MITIKDLQSFKQKNEKFSCLTAYDACFAKLIADIGIETQLIGDSVGNVIQGHQTTVPVTIDEMCYHTRHVARGNTNSLLFADMPFMSYAAIEQALQNAGRLMQAGGHVVKMEGGEWLCETIYQLTTRGIPVCSHLGLTPQSVHQLGGFKVQGRDQTSAERLIQEAKSVVEAGASVLVLECIPESLAADITAMLPIPVIGIGAGAATDAQVMVLYDILGLNSGYTPKFVKNFMDDVANETHSIRGAIEAFHHAVKQGLFPSKAHAFA